MNKCEFCGANAKTIRMCADCFDTYRKLRVEDDRRERLNLRASGLQYDNSPEELAELARKYLHPALVKEVVDEAIEEIARGAYVLR